MVKTAKKVAKGSAGKTVHREVEETAEKSTRGPRSGTIVALVRAMLEEDPEISTESMIKHVMDVFPSSMFNGTHASYYRNKLRAEGMDIPTRSRGRKSKAEDETDEVATPTPKKPKTKLTVKTNSKKRNVH